MATKNYKIQLTINGKKTVVGYKSTQALREDEEIFVIYEGRPVLIRIASIRKKLIGCDVHGIAV